MTYVMSDIHGCYNKYRCLLEKIGFCDDDELYILGDVIDRDGGGIDILFDMMERENVHPFLGNHERMMLSVLSKTNTYLTAEQMNSLKELYYVWVELNGGRVTVDAYKGLCEQDKERIIRYLDSFEIFDEIKVAGRVFFLSHAGIVNFDPKKDICEYDPADFISGRMDYSKKLFDDKYVVSGHTPTAFIDYAYKGRIWQKNNHIALDCGATFGNPLGCVCLETLEEFYYNV